LAGTHGYNGDVFNGGAEAHPGELLMTYTSWQNIVEFVEDTLKSVLLVLFAMGIGVPVVVHAQDVPEGFSVSSMTRATIFVRDLDQSLQLYRDLLGLKTRVDTVVEGDRINEIMGTEGYGLKAVILQSGESIIGNIGIYEIIGDDRDTVPLPSDRVDTVTGDFAIVFITNDIDGLTEKVRAAGYPLISPPMVLFPREDAQVQTREMMFRDRDGVLVNLIELGVPKPW
jgi:catechol 2,3-dioxygenase-like lactoylglutathione lyase family enzyme